MLDDDAAVDPTKKIVSLHAFILVHRFSLLFFTHIHTHEERRRERGRRERNSIINYPRKRILLLRIWKRV